MMLRLTKTLARLCLALIALTGCLPAAPLKKTLLPSGAANTGIPQTQKVTPGVSDLNPAPAQPTAAGTKHPATGTPTSVPDGSYPPPGEAPAWAATPAAPRAGQPRGYLTTPVELQAIAANAAQGLEPYHAAVALVLKEAVKPWQYHLDSPARCPNAEEPAWNDNDEGTPRLYARALAYHLTGEAQYAREAAAILERIMTEVTAIQLDEAQCRLNFSWGAPELVASADLLEEYWHAQTCSGPASAVPGDIETAQGPCKRLFQNWLAKNVYYVVSMSAEGSMNNWGAAGTNTTAYIADYLWDRSDIRLVARTSQGELHISPAQAYQRANQQALDRMNGYRVDEITAHACDFLAGSQQKQGEAPVKSQISEQGIIPDDARRMEACNIASYNGGYQNYPQLHLGHNIQQCELMLRRGDSSCYDNVSLNEVPAFTFTDENGRKHTTALHAGRGSIERAIKAIIVDSKTEWRKDSSLEVAYRYYYTHHTLPGIEQWAAQLDRPAGCSQDICFGTLTHGFADGQTPDLSAAPPSHLAASLVTAHRIVTTHPTLLSSVCEHPNAAASALSRVQGMQSGEKTAWRSMRSRS